MKNKKLLKAGLVTAAVVLSCSMLFGCGNDKPKDSKPAEARLQQSTKPRGDNNVQVQRR